jgi:hypothetical protein
MTNWLKLGEIIKLTNRMYAKNRDIHSESRLEKWTNCPKKKAGGMRRDGFAMGGGGRKKLCRFGRGYIMSQLVYEKVGWCY